MGPRLTFRSSSLLLRTLTLLIVSSCATLADQPPPADANIFTDLWSTLTQSGKAAACPGECVHAITSIFCDHVLEEVSCNANYLRCCVPSDFSYGTPVETSPPLGHEIDKLYAVTDNPTNVTVRPLIHAPVVPIATHNVQSTPITAQSEPLVTSTTSTQSPLPSTPTKSFSLAAESSNNVPTRVSSGRPVTTTTERTSRPSTTAPSTTTFSPIMHPDCPGVCIKEEFARFCGNIMSNGKCHESNEVCCLQSEKDTVNLTSGSAGAGKGSIKPLAVAAMSFPEKAIHESAGNVEPSQAPVTEPDLPTQNCDGTCVAPLFSLLCDEVDHDKFCANGGSCCLNKEATTTPTPPGPCPGSCIPTFLSGVCNRPSELILKTTDCYSGTICCKTPSTGDSQPDADPEAQMNKNHDFPEPHHNHPPPPPLLSKPPRRPIQTALPPMYNQSPPMHQPPFGNHPYPYIPRPNTNMNNRPLLTSFLQAPLPPPPQPPQRLPPQQYGSVHGSQQPPSLHPTAGAPYQPSKQLPPMSPPVPVHQNNHGNQYEQAGHLLPSQPVSTFLVAPQQPQQELHFIGAQPVFCPGPCISPMLKFTCFGSSSLYPKFHCPKPGQTCCAPISNIEAFESSVLMANEAVEPSFGSGAHSEEPLKQQYPDQVAVVTMPPSPVLPPVPLTTTPPAPERTVPTTLSTTTISTMALPALGTFDSSPLNSQPVKPPPKRHSPYTCGVKGNQRQVSPRIVGGSDAEPSEWCWQIALINAQNQYLCGGALIGNQWVITAAHCITTLVRNGEEIYIRVGDYDLTNSASSKTAQTQKVSTTYIHHNHNSQTLDNDIALLKMESAVELNEGVCLVCLPARNSNRKAGKKCTVTGYGYTSEAGPIALKVREAPVPVVDDQECTVKINAVTEKLFILPASSFCAGGSEGNDACQGDGGGPLVCEQDGFYELNGLVSWGFGCGRQDVPAVYVKVSSFIGWVNQIISVNNNN